MTDRLTDLRADRARIAKILQQFEDGMSQYGPDGRGELTNDVSEERQTSLNHQLSQLDRQIKALEAD